MLASRTSLIAALLSLATLASTASASAQDDIRKRGDKACGADSRRMCSKFFGDDMQVLACLQKRS